MRKTRGSKAHTINSPAGHKKRQLVEFGHYSSQKSQNTKNGTGWTPVPVHHTTNHGPNKGHLHRQVVVTAQANYFFLGSGFLPLACPTLAWKVLREALSFAFLLGFLGGVFSSLSPSSWDACRFFEGVVLGLPPPPPPPALPRPHCLIRAYPSPHHRHQASRHQRGNGP